MDSDSFGARGRNEALWDWNLVSNRIHFSPGWLCLVGCEAHEVGGTQQAWLERVHPEDLGQVSQTIAAALADGPEEFELRHRMLHGNGSYRWMSCRGVVQRNAAGQAVHVSASHADVTAETASDPLTGLPNRLLLLERLTRSIERATRYPGFHFAVLCIDLDRPADSAETFEQATGPLLTAAARRLETCLRVREAPPTLRNNDLVARLEGDQFAILLDGLKEVGHAPVAADRILAEILAPFTMGGREVRVSASIGIAVSATGYARADEVLRDADTALHRAKLLGGARCEVFDTGVMRSAQSELRLETDLHGALERGEFLLLYQPIVSLASNQIVGFEALVRWQHPALGMIPPLEFIPITEKAGLIVPVGHWVLREACRQLKAWQDSLPVSKELWVSVNLSILQFRHPKLVEEIAEVLSDSGLDARCLVLELTEGTAVESPAAVTTLLMQLRAMGVRVSVDDFGTGHSSLSYLRQFPLDTLKVDRSFVRGIEANKDMQSILTAVSAMAQQLGLRVVAEGIENEGQLALVQALNCEFGQGYLFSRPLDRDKAAALLKTGLPPRHLGGREQDAASALRREPPEAEQPDPRRARTMRWAYAALAVVVVTVSAGLPRVLRPDPEPSAQAVPRLTSETVSTPVETPGSADVEVAAPAGRAVALTPEPRPAAPAVVRRGGAAGGPVVRAAEPVQPAPTLVQPAPTPEKPVTSLRVVHQHRLGSCLGLLVVSRDGIAFIPDENTAESKDAFSLKHAEFLHDLAGDSLTIKSSDRTYRFKAADRTGGDDDQLEKLVASVTRLR